MAARSSPLPVEKPNLGVFLGVPPNIIPLRAMRDCLNVRIKNGRIENLNIGYTKFSPYKLNGLIGMIDTFFLSNGGQKMIVATNKDLYEYDEADGRFYYLSPRYETGTVTVTKGSATVTGAGTSWLANLKIGDEIAFGATGLRFGGHTNRFGWSEDLTNPVWGKTNVTISANFRVNAFDGKLTADKLIESSDIVPSLHFVNQDVVVTGAGQTRTVSVALHAEERSWAALGFFGVAAPADAVTYLNLANGQPGTSGANISIDSIRPLAGGWYRIGVSVVSDSAGSLNFGVGPTTGDGVLSYIGDGTSGISVYGGQIEPELAAPVYYVPTQEPWYEIVAVNSDTEIVLNRPYAEVSAGPGLAYTARKTFTGDIFDVWSSETFPEALPAAADVWFATNGVNRVVEWDGIATQVTVTPGLDFRCKTLHRFKNMMVYANLILDSGTQRPYSIRNSDIGTPRNVTTGSAAEFRVHDGVDPLLTMETLGDVLTIYGERSITTAAFVEQLIFIFRTAVAGLGPVSSRSVADFGDFHEFLGTDAHYKFDGIGLAVINEQVWPEILRTQDPKRITLGHSIFDEEQGELLWFLPRTTDADLTSGPPERAYVEHYIEDVGETEQTPYTIRELPASAAGYWQRESTLTWNQIASAWSAQQYRWNDRFLQAAFPLVLIGGAEGFIYTINSGGSKDGEAMRSFVRFGRLALGSRNARGMIRRIYPFVSQLPAAGYTLSVNVYYTDDYSGTPTKAGPFAYDITHAGERFVNPRVLAGFAEIEFETNGVNVGWILSGYDIDVVPAGRR